MKRLRKLVLRLALGLVVLLVALVVTLPGWVHAIGGAYDGAPGDLDDPAPAVAQVVERTLTGLDPERVFDMHVHAVGVGTGGSGCRVSSRMQSPLFPLDWVRFRVYASAAGIRDFESADQQYVERLVALAQGSPLPLRGALLAFDRHYGDDGLPRPERTELYVPNEYVFGLARDHPDLFVPALSIHPYREDALAELERGAERGARLVKWLPNAMGIDPLDPRCEPFFERMSVLGLVLLSHAGVEKAVHAEEAQELGNPLRLRAALDRGVRVVVAHCASLGEGLDLDDPTGRKVPNFDLFLRLMAERRYEGLVFGEISAITQVNRFAGVLDRLLERDDLFGRLVNGSDYPLPAVNVVFQLGALERAGYLEPGDREVLGAIYDANPLFFDLALKRAVRHPTTGAAFPPAVFELPDGLLDLRAGLAPAAGR